MDWDRNADQWYLGEPDLCRDERGELLLRASTSYVLDRWTLTVNWSIYTENLVLVRLTVLDHGQHHASAVLLACWGL